MPSNFDLSQLVDVYVRVTDGEVGAASSLTPKIRPLSLPEEDQRGHRQGDGLRFEGPPHNRQSERYQKKTKNIKHIEIAKVMRPRSMAKELEGTVKEIGPSQVISVVSPNTPAMYELQFEVPMSRAVINNISTCLDARTISLQLAHSGSPKAENEGEGLGIRDLGKKLYPCLV